MTRWALVEYWLGGVVGIIALGIYAQGGPWWVGNVLAPFAGGWLVGVSLSQLAIRRRARRRIDDVRVEYWC